MAGSSACAKIVLIIFLIVLLLNSVCFIAPGWLVQSHDDPTSKENKLIGLWFACTNKHFDSIYNLEPVSECVDTLGTFSVQVQWWEAVQTLTFIGILLYSFGFITFFVYVCTSGNTSNDKIKMGAGENSNDKIKRGAGIISNDKIKMGAGILCFLSGLFWLIGLIVFAAKYQEEDARENATLSYAWGLSIVTVLANFAVGGVTFTA